MSHDPLQTAAARGDVAEVRRLLAAGADVDATCDGGRTALFVAARHGRADVVRVLLAAKANVDSAATTDGATPLLMAAANGHLTVVQTLLGRAPTLPHR